MGRRLGWASPARVKEIMKNDRPITKPTEESFDAPLNPSAHSVTTWIDKDEGAYGLQELDLMLKSNLGWHRFQIIRVMRNDEFAVWFKDMGPRELYNTDQIKIQSGYPVRAGGRIQFRTVDTVGELIDAANELRQLRPYQQVMGLEPSNLVESYYTGMEYAKDRVLHPGKTVFGHGD